MVYRIKWRAFVKNTHIRFNVSRLQRSCRGFAIDCRENINVNLDTNLREVSSMFLKAITNATTGFTKV